MLRLIPADEEEALEAEEDASVALALESDEAASVAVEREAAVDVDETGSASVTVARFVVVELLSSVVDDAAGVVVGSAE